MVNRLHIVAIPVKAAKTIMRCKVTVRMFGSFEFAYVIRLIVFTALNIMHAIISKKIPFKIQRMSSVRFNPRLLPYYLIFVNT